MNDEQMAELKRLHTALGQLIYGHSFGEIVTTSPGQIIPTDQNLKPLGTGFKWGRSSVGKMDHVDKRLIECATLALTKYTTQDFTLFEGLRTITRQRQLVEQGKSQTLQSQHLVGLAVDLVPIIKGVARWDWEGCYKIAYAMDQAATELGIAHLITWGGAWDRRLSDFGGSLPLYRKEVELYNARHPGKDFNDGPHFQIEKP